MTATNWSTGQPSTVGGAACTTISAVANVANRGSWSSSVCTAHAYGICERTVNDPFTQTTGNVLCRQFGWTNAASVSSVARDPTRDSNGTFHNFACRGYETNILDCPAALNSTTSLWEICSAEHGTCFCPGGTVRYVLCCSPVCACEHASSGCEHPMLLPAPLC